LEERHYGYHLAMTTISDAVYAIWGLDSNSSTEFTHLYMQKINNVPVSNDDPVVAVPFVSLLGCRPNPFKSTVTIAMESTRSAACELGVYNLRGQKVKQLMTDRIEQGSYSYSWDGKDESGAVVAAGIYFLRLQAEGQQPATAKILKLN
jgi:Tol biopolymer transport system component